MGDTDLGSWRMAVEMVRLKLTNVASKLTNAGLNNAV